MGDGGDNDMLRYSFVQNNGVLVIESNDNLITAVYRPDATPEGIQELRRYASKPIKLKQVSEEVFSELLSKKYEIKSGAAIQLAENISERMDLKQLMHDLPKASDLLESENDAPVINLLNALFSEAVKQNASDIHLETFENRMPSSACRNGR